MDAKDKLRREIDAKEELMREIDAKEKKLRDEIDAKAKELRSEIDTFEEEQKCGKEFNLDEFEQAAKAYTALNNYGKVIEWFEHAASLVPAAYPDDETKRKNILEAIETRIQKAKKQKLEKSLSKKWDLLEYAELVDLLAE